MKLAFAIAVTLVALVAPTTAGAAIYFDFQRVTNTNSLLIETWQDASTGKVYAQQSWRAGSGTGTDDCVVNVGWLPAGYYNIVEHYDHYDATKIKGRVWHLNDKLCSKGSFVRGDLFIHSEETAANGQTCGYPYDEHWCWDGPSDYYSQGCIKLAHATPYPSDIGQADNDWHGWGGGTGYLNLYHRVYVYGP